jgi:hypothetical protein
MVLMARNKIGVKLQISYLVFTNNSMNLLLVHKFTISPFLLIDFDLLGLRAESLIVLRYLKHTSSMSHVLLKLALKVMEPSAIRA